MLRKWKIMPFDTLIIIMNFCFWLWQSNCYRLVILTDTTMKLNKTFMLAIIKEMSRQELRSTGGNCQGDDRQKSYSSAGNCQADEQTVITQLSSLPSSRGAGFSGPQNPWSLNSLNPVLPPPTRQTAARGVFPAFDWASKKALVKPRLPQPPTKQGNSEHLQAWVNTTMFRNLCPQNHPLFCLGPK